VRELRRLGARDRWISAGAAGQWSSEPNDVAARRDPIREWRDGFARGMHSIDFAPVPEAPFHASVVPILHGVRTTLSAGFTFRDDELVKDSGGDAFSLVLSRSKNLEVAQRGHEVRLSRGDATLLHVGETGHVGANEDFEFIVQMIPYTEAAARGVCLDSSVTRRLPAQNEALQLLWSSIRSLERRKLPVSQDVCALMHRHIVDLAAIAFSSQARLGESELSAVATARLDRALEHIAAHFHEPGFSAATVAQRQGISPRYLQRLLESSGATFTARVTELRLQRAHSLLTEAPDGAGRIIDVALQAGFSDISQFNRLFRARFGDTPSAVRAERRTKE
jgi:AraC-like DNA-binding protein